jgi:integrase
MDKKKFAVLYPLNRDLQKKWFVKYREMNFRTGSYDYKKYSGQLNRIPDIETRMKEAEQIIFKIENNIPLDNMSGIRKQRDTIQYTGFANIHTLLMESIDMRYASGELERISYISYKSKIGVLNDWLLFCGNTHIPFGAFTISHGKDFIIWMKTVRKYSNKYINEIRTLLFTSWKEIISRYEIKNVVNPWADMKSLPKKSQRFRTLTIDIEKKIAASLPLFDMQLYIASQFVYYDFIRITELTKLKLYHINWQRAEITVPESISRKSKKDRTLVIPDQLMQILHRLHYDEYDQSFYIFSHEKRPGSKQVGKNYFSKLFRQFREKEKIPSDYKLYGFKHTGNSKLASIGVNAQIQQKHNGHASLEYTQRYTNLSNEDVAFLKHRFPTFGEKGKSLFADDTGMELPSHIMKKLIDIIKSAEDVV